MKIHMTLARFKYQIIGAEPAVTSIIQIPEHTGVSVRGKCISPWGVGCVALYEWSCVSANNLSLYGCQINSQIRCSAGWIIPQEIAL